jgi:pilus assembly protein Flp/PilA
MTFEPLVFWRNNTGATAIEYSLIAGLIAVVIIASVALVGADLQSTFTVLASAT